MRKKFSHSKDIKAQSSSVNTTSGLSFSIENILKNDTKVIQNRTDRHVFPQQTIVSQTGLNFNFLSNPLQNYIREYNLNIYPILWQGMLYFKNSISMLQMHISVDSTIAQSSLPLFNWQTIRVSRRYTICEDYVCWLNTTIKSFHEHCFLIGMPSGRDLNEIMLQNVGLRDGIISYLNSENCAGITILSSPDNPQFKIHVLPMSDNFECLLSKIPPHSMNIFKNTPNLLFI